MILLILQALFPVGDTVLHNYFCSQKRAVHGYAACLHQGAAPSLICGRVNRIFLPSLQKILLQSQPALLPIRTHQLCQSDKCFPPGRSYCLPVNHSPSCCVLYALFSHSVHSAPVCGLRNVQNNKAVQSVQKSSRFPYPAPLSGQKNNLCSSPSKYSVLPAPCRCVHCQPHQICGHYVWDCKRRFSLLCRYVLSVSLNQFPSFFL